jgi:hypothetical protein
VPRNLVRQQQDAQLSVCADLLQQTEADPEWTHRVIAGDERWFFQYDPETKHQFGMAFKGITKAKESTHIQVKSEIFARVLLWFHEYCSQTVVSWWTVNQYHYTEILGRLREPWWFIQTLRKIGSFIMTMHQPKQRPLKWGFGHPNASRWCCNLLTQLVSHLSTSFLFTKV